MNQIDAMQIYVSVAELSSFTLAAQSLNLPKSSISTAVQRLENMLGARLLHRTTRHVQMTQDGQVFYRRCKDILADMEDLQSLFQQDSTDLKGRLRIDMPMGIARTIIMPRLSEFMALYPNIDIEVSCTDRLVDVVHEGFDCVLRVGSLSDSTLIARNVGQLELLNCASPDYLSTCGTPQCLDDLAKHQLIYYVTTLGTKPSGFEYVEYPAKTIRHVAMAGRVTVNNSDAYEAACLAGLGIIQAPRIGMQPHINRGALVEILPEYRAQPMPISLLYGNRHHLPKRVYVFMNWLEEQLNNLRD
ncbi:LysR family transcriptional regulator [Tolumonas lignilytica]|uniref:LysR family transcriptional regulator n=1 Tax=Tolumonas lignilytica TaxID=1283284 RepID=UPI000464A402|nr:LysR family transcriptional regulator [Tolumonas lignilytica]